MVTGPSGVLDMAKSEFDVLEVFLKRANRMLTRTAISEAIGLSEDPENSRAVDIRIMRLRKKIEDDPGNPKFLRTVRGEGYIFSLPGEETRRALTCPSGRPAWTDRWKQHRYAMSRRPPQAADQRRRN